MLYIRIHIQQSKKCIFRSEHIQKLFPSHCDSLYRRKALGHKLPPILRTPTKKIQCKFHLLAPGTWTPEETSLHVKNPSWSDDRILVTSELRRLRITELSILYHPTSLRSCNGDDYCGCGSSYLCNGGIVLVKVLDQHGLDQLKKLQSRLPDGLCHFGSNDRADLLLTHTCSPSVADS